MASATIALNKSVTSKDGKHPVNLRVNDRARKISLATGFSASVEEWDAETHRFRQGSGIRKFKVVRLVNKKPVDMDNQQANDELGAIQKKADGILEDFEDNKVDWTLDLFREKYDLQRTSQTFLNYANVCLARYRRIGAYGTASILSDALRDLAAYCENPKAVKQAKMPTAKGKKTQKANKDLSQMKIARKDIKDIDRKFVQGYIDYCVNDAPNTISVRLRAVRAVLNDAIRDKVGSRATYPFGVDGVKIPSESQTRTHNYLPIELLKTMAHTTFDNPAEEEARHVFLFMFFAAGINYMDAAKLTSKNLCWETLDDGTTQQVIRYRRSKTNKEIMVFVNENVRRELDWFRDNSVLLGDRLLPIIGKEQKPEDMTEYIHQRRKRFNRQLRAIAKDLGFDEAHLNLGSYHARHSFAMASRKNGIADNVIAQALGHSDPRTVKSYFAAFGSAEMMKATTIDL